jgi:hypothetical protein
MPTNDEIADELIRMWESKSTTGEYFEFELMCQQWDKLFGSLLEIYSGDRAENRFSYPHNFYYLEQHFANCKYKKHDLYCGSFVDTIQGCNTCGTSRLSVANTASYADSEFYNEIFEIDSRTYTRRFDRVYNIRDPHNLRISYTNGPHGRYASCCILLPTAFQLIAKQVKQLESTLAMEQKHLTTMVKIRRMNYQWMYFEPESRFSQLPYEIIDIIIDFACSRKTYYWLHRYKGTLFELLPPEIINNIIEML